MASLRKKRSAIISSSMPPNQTSPPASSEPQPVLPTTPPHQRKKRSFKPRVPSSPVFSTILLFLLAPAIALSVTTFMFQSYQVDGESMETTLQNNNRLIVDKVPRTWSRITNHQFVPKRGNIIIFNELGLYDANGNQERQLIKRVIGLPGDHVVVKNGKITAGYGTDDRYIGRTNFNSFSEKQNITLLGAANNINRTGFAQEDFSAFTGQNKRGGGSANTPQGSSNASKGFQETQSGGINYTDMVTPNTELTGSYFYNHQNFLTERGVERQNFLHTSTYFSHSKDTTRTDNRNHRINATLDQKIDSLTSFRFMVSGSFTANTVGSGAFSKNLRGDTLLQSQQKRHSYTEGGGFGGSSSFLFRHRLRKAGRTVSLNLAYSRNTSERDLALQSQVSYFNSVGLPYRNDTIDQTDDRTNHRNDYSTTLSYTEPLSKKLILEGNYKIGKADNYEWTGRPYLDLYYAKEDRQGLHDTSHSPGREVEPGLKNFPACLL